ALAVDLSSVAGLLEYGPARMAAELESLKPDPPLRHRSRGGYPWRDRRPGRRGGRQAGPGRLPGRRPQDRGTTGERGRRHWRRRCTCSCILLLVLAWGITGGGGRVRGGRRCGSRVEGRRAAAFRPESTRVTARLDISAEVAEALRKGRPVVALETSIVGQGLPAPHNLHAATGC